MPLHTLQWQLKTVKLLIWIVNFGTEGSWEFLNNVEGEGNEHNLPEMYSNFKKDDYLLDYFEGPLEMTKNIQFKVSESRVIAAPNCVDSIPVSADSMEIFRSRCIFTASAPLLILYNITAGSNPTRYNTR